MALFTTSKFTGALDGNEKEVIIEHTFAPTDELRIESGNTKISLALMASDSPDGKVPDPPVIINVAAHTKQVITASKFGNLQYTFLWVVNNEATGGNYKVSLL